ncbi:MAG: DNA/RNA non-specific endonuclease [Phycisphaerales bacterium]|nr:MAG: DNA/RNA non-specific endonuclease [Phycisphaerales bacterium]
MTRSGLIFALLLLCLGVAACRAPAPIPPRAAAPAAEPEPVAPRITPFGLQTQHRRPTLAGEPRASRAASRFQRLENDGFIVGYANDLRAPLWAAWTLGGTSQTFDAPRPQLRRWSIDTRAEARATQDDFRVAHAPGVARQPHFAPGHLASPEAIGRWYGRTAQIETYLITNAVAMDAGFRVGVWHALELAEDRLFVPRFRRLWVIAGPVFEPDARGEFSRTGDGGVPIPTAFFRVVLDVDGDPADLFREHPEQPVGVRALSLLIPHDAAEDSRLGAFMTTIGEIESRTGLDLLPNLPEPLKSRLREQRPDGGWMPNLRLRPSEIQRNEAYDGA